MTRSWTSFSCNIPRSFPSEQIVHVPVLTSGIIGGGRIYNDGTVGIDIYTGIFFRGSSDRKIAFSKDENFDPGFKHHGAVDLKIEGQTVFVFLEDISK